MLKALTEVMLTVRDKPVMQSGKNEQNMEEIKMRVVHGITLTLKRSLESKCLKQS